MFVAIHGFETGRQTDGQSDMQKDGQAFRSADRLTGSATDRQRQVDCYTGRPTDRLTDIQTDREARGRQAHRKTD